MCDKMAARDGCMGVWPVTALSEPVLSLIYIDPAMLTYVCHMCPKTEAKKLK